MSTSAKSQSLSFNDYWLSFIRTCFRPLIRILIKNKVEFKSFVNICRDLYIEEAENFVEQNSTDKRGKISSIAYQTGLDRREVSKALKEKPSDSTLTEANRSRESSILDHWHSDALFCDNNLKPRPLKRSGPGMSFETLVQRFGKNISHGPILNSLVEAGCVKILNNKIHFISKKYVPASLVTSDMVHVAGNAIARLSKTIEHNISNAENKHFQRVLFSSKINKKYIDSFKNDASRFMQKIVNEIVIPELESIEEKYRVLAQANQACPLGIGFYYFDDNTEESS